MAEYSKKCGPEAYDNYDGYTSYSNSSKKYRHHTITGKGVVERCYVMSNFNYEDSYTVNEGITELGDGCFSKYCVNSIYLPKTLEVIGNNCFKSSRITNISLPTTLKKIGHSNFPTTLTSLTIPALIVEFFIDNFFDCRELTAIHVDKKNTKYKSVDGILYNYEMTEILYCPDAKTGKVIIPNTVKRIGDYCFRDCKLIKSVIIPPTVEYIGDFAFCNSSFDKLVIPNSVKATGQGCFKQIVVRHSLKFSSQIRILTNDCFRESDIKKIIFSFCNVTEIGDNAFASIKTDIVPPFVSFESLQHLGVTPFNYYNEDAVFEFFSCLNKIDEAAFLYKNGNVKLRYYSISPIRLSRNAFRGISDNATLIVPKGSKIIFQNAIPWSVFTDIRESELDIDFDDDGNEVAVSDETHLKRLRSVAESKIKADRYFLKEIIEDLYLNYLYVDNDEEYKEALELIEYNRSFSPAIVANLEQKMCQNWANKYKIKIAARSIWDGSVSNVSMNNVEPAVTLPEAKDLALPVIDVPDILSEAPTASVQVIFNNDIQKQLQNLLTLTKKNLRIAVSWFTNYSLFKQVKEIASGGIKVQLITNNDLTNNGGYCLNLNELIDTGVEISLIEYPHLLHHKFCIIDDDIVVNGSYNWTRFSAKNYENVTVIRNDADAIDAFIEEFENLLQDAEHRNIKEMPEFVPERPEYDRSAFKQYVTEELDAEARESSAERDKITALQKAALLNPEYLEKINPEARKNYAKEFKTVKESVAMQNTIAAMVEDKPVPTPVSVSDSTSASNSTISDAKTVKSSTINSATKQTVVATRATQQAVEKVKASGLLMVLDVSGSMAKTYKAGHVHNISKKALAASLAITDSKEVSLWTFGSTAQFIGNIGVDSISKIEKVQCKSDGTELKKFVDAADNSIKDNALVIIFTDDDSSSIAAAISAMQKRNNVFWQIIVYGVSHENITRSISNVANTSVVSLTDYASKTEEHISLLLLKDYIDWKKKKMQ